MSLKQSNLKFLHSNQILLGEISMTKEKEQKTDGVIRTRTDCFAVASKEEICARWIAEQESGPFGIDPLVKVFLQTYPEHCPPFVMPGSAKSPSKAKWEKISRAMLFANKSIMPGDPVLYPQAMLEAELPPKVVREFTALATQYGVTLQAIPVRNPAPDDGMAI